MAISRRIVEAHGGRIAIGSSDRPGSDQRGAEIILILPRDEPSGNKRQGTSL
jgi:signal transduction histidine kinase